MGRLSRAADHILRRGARPRPDRFADFRSLDGPILVGGPTTRHLADLDVDPRLVVLMPHLDLRRMSGGPNTLLQLTARLLPLGVRIRYVATLGRLDPDRAALLDHLRSVTGIEPEPSAVELIDASTPGAELGLGARDVLLASWWPTAHMANAALDAVQIHGGSGYMAELGLEKLARDAKMFEIGGGTNEIQLQTIARALLGRAVL